MSRNTPISSNAIKRYALLFEMLRSFATLSETLNLSRAVTKLGSTRQTIRRHIALLEELKGGALFTNNERQYALTPLGRSVLPEALDLLSQAEAWVKGESRLVDGLPVLSSVQDDGWFFHQQQHPLLKLHSSESPMLRDLLIAWVQAGGRVEDPALTEMRTYAMVFRRSGEQWIFTEVGENSGFAKWFGWKYARSVIGRVMAQLPRGASMERLMHSVYHEVEDSGGARYDHIFTVFPHGADQILRPLGYERLLLAVQFPDESYAIMSAARPSYDLEIQGVDLGALRQMPEELLM